MSTVATVAAVERQNTSTRFLDLPAELRLMVYDYLPVTTRHSTFKQPVNDPEEPRMRDLTITLVVKFIPAVALLATCKLICNEASPILAHKLEEIRQSPLQLIVDSPCLRPLFGVFCFMDIIMKGKPSCISSGSVHVPAHGNDLISGGHLVAFKRVYGEVLDPNSLCDFLQLLATYIRARTPSSSVIAITRHPLHGLRRAVSHLRSSMIWSGTWPMTHGPTCFMLREAIADAFDDPPSTSNPEGIIRACIAHLVHTQSMTSAIYGIAEAVWSKDWQEGERAYLR